MIQHHNRGNNRYVDEREVIVNWCFLLNVVVTNTFVFICCCLENGVERYVPLMNIHKQFIICGFILCSSLLKSIMLEITPPTVLQ